MGAHRRPRGPFRHRRRAPALRPGAPARPGRTGCRRWPGRWRGATTGCRARRASARPRPRSAGRAGGTRAGRHLWPWPPRPAAARAPGATGRPGRAARAGGVAGGAAGRAVPRCPRRPTACRRGAGQGLAKPATRAAPAPRGTGGTARPRGPRSPCRDAGATGRSRPARRGRPQAPGSPAPRGGRRARRPGRRKESVPRCAAPGRPAPGSRVRRRGAPSPSVIWSCLFPGRPSAPRPVICRRPGARAPARSRRIPPGGQLRFPSANPDVPFPQPSRQPPRRHYRRTRSLNSAAIRRPNSSQLFNGPVLNPVQDGFNSEGQRPGRAGEDPVIRVANGAHAF